MKSAGGFGIVRWVKIFFERNLLKRRRVLRDFKDWAKKKFFSAYKNDDTVLITRILNKGSLFNSHFVRISYDSKQFYHKMFPFFSKEKKIGFIGKQIQVIKSSLNFLSIEARGKSFPLTQDHWLHLPKLSKKSAIYIK